MYRHEWRKMHVYDLLAAVALEEKPRSYLGIGVWKGDCISSVVKNYKGLEDVVICDPLIGHCGGPKDPAFLLPKLRALSFDGELRWVHGPSKPDLENYLSSNGVTFDMAYVDGDHSYEMAAYDIATVVPRARVTLVHDLDHETVWRAFREYVQQHPLPFWVTAESQGTGIIYNELIR